MNISPSRALRAVLLVLSLLGAAPARAFVPCERLWRWLEYQCAGLGESWRDGSADLFLTGWTYHDRNTYSPEKIKEFNERAWGGGLGISKRNAQGDAFGWYALAFKDSHYQTTKMAGWWWMTYWPADADYGAGLGYTAFMGSRPDIYGGVPFPGVLPLASIRLNRIEVLGTYIPKINANTTGNGNVAFLFLHIHF